jgi:hypothetical protein
MVEYFFVWPIFGIVDEFAMNPMEIGGKSHREVRAEKANNLLDRTQNGL